MKKIVVIGAGIGGLVAAEILGRNGYNVEVYERASEDSLGYDWYDEVDKRIFEKTNIPDIDKKDYYKADDWSFVSPNGETIEKLDPVRGDSNINLWRKALSKHLIDRAKKYANVYFDKKVDNLFIEDSIVKGIMINGKVIEASLVIDSSGVLSKFRASLPANYFIHGKAEKEEFIYIYRGIYNELPTTEDIIHLKKIYLKYINQKSVCWCIALPNKTVDIMVGVMDPISKDDIGKAVKSIQADNKHAGNKLIAEGKMYTVPTRYPLAIMIGQGYVAIGDAAFMTLPIHGSGIACSMMAGSILGETITSAGEDTALSVSNLWRYQVKYYKEFGIKYCAIDMYKRWLINASSEDVNYALKHKIIDKNDMRRIIRGELINLSANKLIAKLKRGYKNIPLLLSLLKLIIVSRRAMSIAKRIPAEYNEVKVVNWANKLDNLFKGVY